jgi:cutinase
MLTRNSIHQFVLTGLVSMFFLENTPAATVSINPDNGIRGTLAIIRGSELPPNERVDISWLLPTGFMLAAESVPTDGNGSFTATIVAPKSAPINESAAIFVFKNDGPLIASTSFTVTDQVVCADTYFIGMHGTAEGPDGQNQILSQVIGETWENFYDLATELGKNVKGYAIEYHAPVWQAPISGVNAGRGSVALNEHVLKIEESCAAPSIVLAGYSLGAWAINNWLSEHEDRWGQILAVELYGDPLWYRLVPNGTRGGLARRAGLLLATDLYENDVSGPGALYDRVQSRCLDLDPICGEGWDALHFGNQLSIAVHCGASPDLCEHEKYASEPIKGQGGGYGLTAHGAKFLILKAFPQETAGPEIVHSETFREGDLVFFRVFFTNPNSDVDFTNDPAGFGFRGTNGSLWAEEEHPLWEPSYGRVFLGHPGRLEYPFNHLCDTGPRYESDVEVWILDSNFPVGRRSVSTTVHLACSAPTEVITPFRGGIAR